MIVLLYSDTNKDELEIQVNTEGMSIGWTVVS